MTERPLCDFTGVNTLWAICVQVMDTLEAVDGNRDRANRFFCAFMTEKDSPRLGELIEHTVEAVAW